MRRILRLLGNEPRRSRPRLRARFEQLERRELFAVDFRVATYNALKFGGDDIDRQDEFAVVFEEMDADVIVMQEIVNAAGADLLLGALNNSGQSYARADFIDGNDTDHMLFYRTSVVSLVDENYIDTSLRSFGEYIVDVGGNQFNIYSAHLKASQGTANQQQRLAEVQILRDHLETLPAGAEFIIAGDMNIYTSSEPAYQEFVGSQANNSGRAEDLISSSLVGSWHDNPQFASVHTQSPRTTQFGGGANGGLDDRFDMILAKSGVNDGVGIEYVTNSYTIPGNDGQHFNQSILDGSNSSASPAVIQALHDASDHLPVYADFTSLTNTQYAAIPYTTGFESGDVDQFWALASDNPAGVNEVTSANGPASGSSHLVMTSSTTSTYITNTADLGLELGAQTNVSLSFDWKEFGDETHSQDGVYFSDDGGSTFAKVYDLNGQSTTNNSWQAITLDVDALAQANGLSLTDTFLVRFQQYDNWTINADGFAFDNISVTSGGGGGEYASIPYATGFESGAADSYWTLSTDNPNGRNEVTASSGPAEGTYHVVMASNITSNYTTNRADLRLDLAGAGDVTLNFQWKHFGDESDAQDGVFLSTDGGGLFVPIYDFNPASVASNAWQTVSLDLDSLAANAGLSLSGSTVVRFQQYDNWTVSADGVALDDVQVSAGAGGGYASLPYSTGFEAGAVDQYWGLTSSSSNGLLGVGTGNGPYSGSHHLLMATQVNNAYVLNQADLRVNLQGRSQATLDFFWKEFGDETHAQDGVYLSDDGGASFVKVHDFAGSATTNNTWQGVQLDVDSLAAANNLALTGQFVIRFQQYDNYVLGTDGIAIDQVSIV